VNTQVGIGALTTNQVIERGRYAIERGADALQVTFPFWTEVSDDEAVAFYEALNAAFGGYPMVHYDTGRCKHKLTPQLLERLLEAVPGLIGVKYTGPNYKLLGTFTRNFPSVSFFTTAEWFVTLFRDMGIRGSYDPLVYMNPPLVLRMYELCRIGDFESALEIQQTFQRFYELLGEVGLFEYTDSAIDRCIGLSTGFLDGYTAQVQAPYRSVPLETVDLLRRRVAEELPQLLDY
jgi:4-hydroxy-tetrahydrodipicolinate synthase